MGDVDSRQSWPKNVCRLSEFWVVSILESDPHDYPSRFCVNVMGMG